MTDERTCKLTEDVEVYEGERNKKRERGMPLRPAARSAHEDIDYSAGTKRRLAPTDAPTAASGLVQP